MHEIQPQAPFEPGPDWTEAKPAEIPQPTLWPAFLALGSTLLLWGFITTNFILASGVVVFAISISGWIRDLHHERIQTQRTATGRSEGGATHA